MENKKEMTTPNVSAATDTEQPFPKCTEHSIADCDAAAVIPLVSQNGINGGFV